MSLSGLIPSLRNTCNAAFAAERRAGKSVIPRSNAGEIKACFLFQGQTEEKFSSCCAAAALRRFLRQAKPPQGFTAAFAFRRAARPQPSFPQQARRTPGQVLRSLSGLIPSLRNTCNAAFAAVIKRQAFYFPQRNILRPAFRFYNFAASSCGFWAYPAAAAAKAGCPPLVNGKPNKNLPHRPFPKRKATPPCSLKEHGGVFVYSNRFTFTSWITGRIIGLRWVRP